MTEIVEMVREAKQRLGQWLKLYSTLVTHQCGVGGTGGLVGNTETQMRVLESWIDCYRSLERSDCFAEPTALEVRESEVMKESGIARQPTVASRNGTTACSGRPAWSKRVASPSSTVI